MFEFLRRKIVVEYPNTLPTKIHELLENLDELLVAKNNVPVETTMLEVKSLNLPFSVQHKSVKALTKMLEPALATGKGYIPRGVAVVVAPSGDWQFFYGLRSDVESTTIERHLFIHALTQTNSMRENYEKSTICDQSNGSEDQLPQNAPV